MEITPKDRKRFRKLLDESHTFESLPIRSHLNEVEVARFSVNRFRFPGVEISNSFSVLLPAGTPAAIVRRLSAEAGKAMKSPMLAEKFDALALVPVFDTPEQFAAKLKRQRQAWSAFVSRGGIEQVR